MQRHFISSSNPIPLPCSQTGVLLAPDNRIVLLVALSVDLEVERADPLGGELIYPTQALVEGDVAVTMEPLRNVVQTALQSNLPKAALPSRQSSTLTW